MGQFHIFRIQQFHAISIHQIGSRWFQIENLHLQDPPSSWGYISTDAKRPVFHQDLQNWGQWTQMAPSAPFSARAQAGG